MSGPFNKFLSDCVTDSVNAYASGVREDAGAVAEGRSLDVRGLCPDCGGHIGLRNKGEDGRCRSCNDKALDEAARVERTPERLRHWARTTRNVVALAGQDFPVGAVAECEARIASWEAEADELEAKAKCWECHHALGDHDEKDCRGGEDLPCRCDSFVGAEAELAQEERRTIRAAAAQADTHSSDVEPMVERLESKW